MSSDDEERPELQWMEELIVQIFAPLIAGVKELANSIASLFTRK